MAKRITSKERKELEDLCTLCVQKVKDADDNYDSETLDNLFKELKPLIDNNINDDNVDMFTRCMRDSDDTDNIVFDYGYDVITEGYYPFSILTIYIKDTDTDEIRYLGKYKR